MKFTNVNDAVASFESSFVLINSYSKAMFNPQSVLKWIFFLLVALEELSNTKDKTSCSVKYKVD